MQAPKTKAAPSLSLILVLLMFPQVVETIYSPALPGIAEGYGVAAGTASLTLSVYFLSFAAGVVVWGRLSDTLGRRPAMLAGLIVYGLGAGLALIGPDFTSLLAARMIAAFGAAVGSITSQTILRDRFQGVELARSFTLVGIVVAISPALGMAAGTALVAIGGYGAVFGALLALSLVLLVWSGLRLGETRPEAARPAPLWPTMTRMLRDGHIWRSAGLVALMNLCLFAYFQLAPFRLEKLGLAGFAQVLGGGMLTVGILLGSIANRKLLGHGHRPDVLVRRACLLMLVTGATMLALRDSGAFVLPAAALGFAFALAIPNVLAPALHDYSDRLGTAGAVLGLLYYLLIGAGLFLSAMAQDLGLVVSAAGLAALRLAQTGRDGARMPG